MSEYGLAVTYNGKKYKVYYADKSREYPVGGLICEYSRFDPRSLKKILLNCPYFRNPPYKTSMSEAGQWFYKAVWDRYDTVTATMICADVGAVLYDFIWSDGDTVKKFINELNEDIGDNTMKQYVLEETGTDKFCVDSIGYVLLAAYAFFLNSYTVFEYCFKLLAENDEGNKEKTQEFLAYYARNNEQQNITYKLSLLDGNFCELYIIKSSISLILFEAAHLLYTGDPIVKCKNCGKYFVPAGRSDTVYCFYPSPQDKDRTCKEIGAQVKRRDKEKTDKATKEYRKVYMRYKMMTRRHPDNKEYDEKFKKLTSEIKEWRKKLESDNITTDEFFDWLNNY